MPTTLVCEQVGSASLPDTTWAQTERGRPGYPGPQLDDVSYHPVCHNLPCGAFGSDWHEPRRVCACDGRTRYAAVSLESVVRPRPHKMDSAHEVGHNHDLLA